MGYLVLLWITVYFISKLWRLSTNPTTVLTFVYLVCRSTGNYGYKAECKALITFNEIDIFSIAVWTKMYVSTIRFTLVAFKTNWRNFLIVLPLKDVCACVFFLLTSKTKEHYRCMTKERTKKKHYKI